MRTEHKSKKLQEEVLGKIFARFRVHSHRECLTLTLLDLLISTSALTLFISDTLIPIHSQFMTFNFTCATLTTLTLTSSVSNSVTNLKLKLHSADIETKSLPCLDTEIWINSIISRARPPPPVVAYSPPLSIVNRKTRQKINMEM